MVVGRLLTVALCVAAASATAQDTFVRAWVKSNTITVDTPFWLFIEARGSDIGLPVIPDSDGVVVNTNSPQESRSLAFGGGVRQQTLRLSYYSMASKEGPVTIPPIEILINGKMMKSEAIFLTVQPRPDDAAPLPKPARSWVSNNEVTVGSPFWIYVEASGTKVELPQSLKLDGIVINKNNSQRSSSYSFNRPGQRTTEKQGYHAIAQRPGTLTIPPIEVVVNGRLVRTDPIQLTATESRVPVQSRQAEPTTTAELKQDDLIFIEMGVDRHDVYQGEPVLLTMQLWRIEYKRINSGPYRGGLIIPPTTEGFYAIELEPRSYKATRGPWQYEVTEKRKLLYPTAVGDLQIGKWHWEGIALINRQSIIARDKLYYKLDGGPIDIKVKELPPHQGGFSGAVGQFEMVSALSSNIVTQGVPVELTITVRGVGNPDAIGEPVVPEVDWANISEAEKVTSREKDADAVLSKVTKRYSYAVTAHREGPAILPAFVFTYFDPRAKEYVTEKVGPYNLNVLSSGEAPQHLVIPDDVKLRDRGVDILAEDIRALAHRPETLRVRRTSSLTVPMTLGGPVLGYLALALVMGRRRRFARDIGFARAYRAKAKALKRLRDIANASEPEDKLYRALSNFVSDKLNVPGAGLTSGDVDALLAEHGVEDEIRERTLKVLRSCERARYASQHLSSDEMRALIVAAESCMGAVETAVGKARR